MKKTVILSLPICAVLLCSCQRKESAAEQQVTQPKTEVVARDESLADRLTSLEQKVNSLDQRVKELGEKENTAANIRTSPASVHSQIADPAQLQAEKERMIQQLTSMIPDSSKETAGDPAKQSRPAAQPQLGPEDLQRQWQKNLDKAKMSGNAVFPAAEIASPTPGSALEATSPSPSPTPE